MRTIQQPLFGDRLALPDAIQLTADSLNTYGPNFRAWVMAYSGGKDSSVTVSLVLYLIEQGMVKAPEVLIVLMSDTGQEFIPLRSSAMDTLEVVRKKGYNVQVVEPPLDHRMFVYMLGTGVPPANSRKLRWCTRIMKSDPMNEAVKDLASQYGEVLVLTGVRQGESANRDQAISLSCSKDGGECGQGWFQNNTRPGICSTLAPILHFRLCHIEDWVSFFMPSQGFPTDNLIDIYGFEEDEQLNIRTGCAGCMLVTEDRALNRIISLPGWGYLAPLRRLQDIYEELRRPRNRLRKNEGPKKRKVVKNNSIKLDMSLPWDQLKEQVKALPKQKKQKADNRDGQRLGPLTMEERLWALSEIKAIQEEINTEARLLGRPEMWLINKEEEARIIELIEANTWPRGWTGTETRGDVLLEKTVAEGVIQPLLIG